MCDHQQNIVQFSLKKKKGNKKIALTHSNLFNLGLYKMVEMFPVCNPGWGILYILLYANN